MKKLPLNTLIYLFFSVCLIGCANQPNGMMSAQGAGDQALTGGAPIGGDLAKSMDENDKWKFSKALDNAPGKSTHWVNMGTGMEYTVEPTKKISVNGNPFCRQYVLTATHNSVSQKLEGNACVAGDGNWKTV